MRFNSVPIRIYDAPVHSGAVETTYAETCNPLQSGANVEKLT